MKNSGTDVELGGLTPNSMGDLDVCPRIFYVRVPGRLSCSTGWGPACSMLSFNTRSLPQQQRSVNLP